MSELANFIRQLLAKKGWNQSQLARATGLQESTVSNMLNHGAFPKARTLRALAHALGVDPPILTSLIGYPVEPHTLPEERFMQAARQMEAVPWIAARIEDLLRLSKEEFEEVMRQSAFRRLPQIARNDAQD